MGSPGVTIDGVDVEMGRPSSSESMSMSEEEEEEVRCRAWWATGAAEGGRMDMGIVGGGGPELVCKMWV